MNEMKVIQTMLLIMLVLFFAGSSFAQEQTKAADPISNQDVVEMVKAGLSSEIINAKVLSTDGTFDTSPAALKELKESGVPESVILTMVNNPLGKKSVQGPKAGTAVPTGATSTEPVYGSIEDIKGFSKVFVRADDDDNRSRIVELLGGYEGVEVVNSSQDAEIVLDFATLTRDVAANRGPYAHGASMALKSQMRAYSTRPDGSRLIAWTETETLDVVNAFTLSAPNEVNLTHHFVRALQRARGEETYSLRKLYGNSKKQKKKAGAERGT